MAGTPREQKQRAGTYQGNIDYTSKPHAFRVFRFCLSFCAILLGLGGIYWFTRHGWDEFYNTGPISQKHAEQNVGCSDCHSGKNLELKELLSPQRVKEQLAQAVSFAEIDGACAKCHNEPDPQRFKQSPVKKDYKLHQPDPNSIAFKDFRTRIAMVRVDDCSTCHREHAGAGPIKFTSDADCASCHADATKLDASRPENNIREVKFQARKGVPTTGTTSRLSDGLVHFIPPETFAAQKAEFSHFGEEKGHPPFEYESTKERKLQDPTVLLFGHTRHLKPGTLAKLGGKTLTCDYCHTLSPNGDYYQQVSFNKSCFPCHAIQVDSRLSELKVPHGDVDAALKLLDNLFFGEGIFRKTVDKSRNFRGDRDRTDFLIERQSYWNKKIPTREALAQFKWEVFFTKNPYKGGASQNAEFPGCAYCHFDMKEVNPPPRSSGNIGTPVLTKPVMAERWLGHGEFTHGRHTHVSCTVCHDAMKSEETKDIIMPPKALCAECHRPPVGDVNPDEVKLVKAQPDKELTDRQRKNGGVAFQCNTCHKFHTTPATADEALGASNNVKPTLKQLLLGRNTP